MTEGEFRTQMVAQMQSIATDVAVVKERTNDFPRIRGTVQAMKGALILLSALFPVTVGVIIRTVG